jgi:hypothetical protein
VSRLREALACTAKVLDASAGEGRSDKDHAQTSSWTMIAIQFDPIAV